MWRLLGLDLRAFRDLESFIRPEIVLSSSCMRFLSILFWGEVISYPRY